MTFCTARDVRFSDLSHVDGRLDAGVDSFLLQEVLKRDGIHDGPEHAHVVGPVPRHAVVAQLGSAEVVATTHHHGHLCSAGDHRGYLLGDARYDDRINPQFPSAENLSREFQQHALMRLVHGTYLPGG